MHSEVVNISIKELIKNKINIGESKALVLGYTFKENCPDIRNTRVEFLVDELAELFSQVDIYDPHVDKSEIGSESRKKCFLTNLSEECYELVILAVPHDEFLRFDGVWISSILKKKSVFFDIKNACKGVQNRLTL